MSNSQQWQDFTYTSNDGLRLAGRKYGWQHRDRLAVLCLAGLTRNSADFHELALYLANHEKNPRRVLCLDYRGRGKSQYDKNWKNYNPLVEAGDVIDGLIAAGLDHVAIVGTSRGGMIALALAAMRPGLMKAVVFNDIGPEIDGPGLVRIKNYIEHAKDPGSWPQAVEMLREVSAKQFPNWDDEELDRQARLIYAEKGGKIVRRYDKGMMKSLSSINLDEPLPTYWPQFEGLKKLPLLLIRGENSDLLSLETVERMKKVQPTMEVVTSRHEGHAPNLGAGVLPEKIARFLSAADKMHR
ncbi:MAG: alpha/beta hydrolase [Rhizobiaceae bacterium]|nr:alpha/beta hydrolase [Rhizobiaceae bacterium]